MYKEKAEKSPPLCSKFLRSIIKAECLQPEIWTPTEI